MKTPLSLAALSRPISCLCGHVAADFLEMRDHLGGAGPGHEPVTTIVDSGERKNLYRMIDDNKRRFTRQDMVTVHYVLHRVRRALVDRGVLADVDFPQYDSFGLSPMYFGASRARHNHATLILAKEILAGLEVGNRAIQ